MTKQRYILIGSVALAVTLLGTTALILAAKNVFEGAADQTANPYNSLPVRRIFAQAWAFDGNNINQWKTNQATMEKARKLVTQAAQMSQDKQYQAAIDLYAQSLACLKQYPGLGCIQAVEILTEKAKCEDELGLKKDREQTLRTLVDASGKAYNNRHQQVATALESLGDLLCTQNRQDEAQPLIERACDIRVKGAGLDNGDTAYTISQLAHCNMELKKYKQADELYKKAIAIYEKLDGDGFSESQQIAWENLANSYRWQNRYKDAMDSDMAVLSYLEKCNLGNSYYAACTLTSAASTAQSQKQKAQMQGFLSQAEKIAVQFRTADCRRAAAIYKDIADVYNDDDDIKAELKARQNSLESYKSPKYPQQEEREQLAQNLVKAGACALKLKDYDKAREYYGLALTEARDNQEVRLKLKANKEEIEEYLKYIEKDKKAGHDATMQTQATELKQITG